MFPAVEKSSLTIIIFVNACTVSLKPNIFFTGCTNYLSGINNFIICLWWASSFKVRIEYAGWYDDGRWQPWNHCAVDEIESPGGNLMRKMIILWTIIGISLGLLVAFGFQWIQEQVSAASLMPSSSGVTEQTQMDWTNIRIISALLFGAGGFVAGTRFES